MAIYRINLADGPLRDTPILQPVATLLVYQMEPEVYRDLLGRWPSSAHWYDQPMSYPHHGLLLVKEDERWEVERTAGGAIQLVGRYILNRPTPDSAPTYRWEEAVNLGSPYARELHAEIVALGAQGRYVDVLKAIETLLPRLSPDCYVNFLSHAVRAATQLDREDLERKYAVMIGWVEPDLPTARKILG